MANIVEPTKEKILEISEWVKDRPQIIKDLCGKFSPFKLYYFSQNNCSACLNFKVTIHSYKEDGTLDVLVRRNFNIALEDSIITDVNPELLTECDLPTEEEQKLINYGNKCLIELEEKYTSLKKTNN